MNFPANINPASIQQELTRDWPARLQIHIAEKAGKSVLLRTDHEGPLRVQRPFYPEANGCCHVYLLHPPGGVVVGDKLQITARVSSRAQALLTTPSAGKFYGARDQAFAQCQSVGFNIEDGACLEWLPQETIIFNSARARLETRIHLQGSALFFGWEMVRLGRIASGEHFLSGSCLQNLALWRDGVPLFMEKNKITPVRIILELFNPAVYGSPAR